MRNLVINRTGRNTHKKNAIGWGVYPFDIYFANKPGTNSYISFTT